MKEHPEFKEMSKALEEEEHMISPVPVEQSDWGVPSTSGLSLSQESAATASTKSQPKGALPELPTLGLEPIVEESEESLVIKTE